MEQLSLFDLPINDDVIQPKSSIYAVKASFIESTQKNWKELFEGYSEIKLITFSSGMDFTVELLKMFKYGEVIFGCEDVVNGSISTVLAVETTMVEKITHLKSAEELSSRIDDGSLRIFVSKVKKPSLIHIIKTKFNKNKNIEKDIFIIY